MALRQALGISTIVLVAGMSGIAAEQVRWNTPSSKEVSVTMDPPEVRTSGQFNPEELGLVSRTSRLKGMRIKDEDHRAVGTVQDVIVDLASGRALGLVVQRGEDYVLVPGSVFFPVSEDRAILKDEGRRKLENSPNLAWDSSKVLKADAIESAFRHFAATPIPSRNPVAASTLVSDRVSTQNGRRVGEVLDLVADIPKGELVYVVVSPRRGDSVLYAVPPQKLKVQDGAIQLAVDEQHFLSGPKFPREFWTEMAMPRFASAVYKHYGLLAERNTGAGLRPTGREDHQLRDAFLRHLVNDAAMPASRAKDLIVSTDNGRLVLRGDVESNDAKRKIVSAAEAAAGKGNVVDELHVK